MNYKDVSDALFTEAPSDPFSMTAKMIRDDARMLRNAVWQFVKKKMAKSDCWNERRDEEKTDCGANEEEISFNPDAEYVRKTLETAPRRAFQNFYEKYRGEHSGEKVNEQDTIAVEVNKRFGEEQKLQDGDCQRKLAFMAEHADSLSEPERRRPVPESRSPITGLIPKPENRTSGRNPVKGTGSNAPKDRIDYKSAEEQKRSSAKTGVMPPKKTITF